MIDGARITIAVKGFMNSSVFFKWLQHFEMSVPATIQWPLVLIYDGYSSHYNKEIVAEAIRIKVILVLLPSNSMHMIQPLDVAVFKPFKTILKWHIKRYLIESAVTTISKKDAISVASQAWIEGIMRKEENIKNGFRACGLWPLSFPKMQARWKAYHDGGVSNFQLLVWL